MTGFEPVTSSLPRKRSTPELHRRKVLNPLPLKFLLKEEIPAFAGMTLSSLERETRLHFISDGQAGFPSASLGINFSPYSGFEIHLWSGRPGSNRRHSAWKADALPTELLPHYFLEQVQNNFNISKNFPFQVVSQTTFCGESRIRTCEGENQQIYSLSSLAA